MINGKILISNVEIDRWIKQAIEVDVERKQLNAEAQDEFERQYARSSPNRWTRIEALLDDHCETWSFGAGDRRLIVGVVRPLYEETRKFFDL